MRVSPSVANYRARSVIVALRGVQAVLAEHSSKISPRLSQWESARRPSAERLRTDHARKVLPRVDPTAAAETAQTATRLGRCSSDCSSHLRSSCVGVHPGYDL